MNKHLDPLKNLNFKLTLILFNVKQIKRIVVIINKKISIFIDGDACPVKEEIFKVSYRHNLQVYLVSNQWLRMEVGPNIKKVVVADGTDEADNWIVDNIDGNGIAITADIPLAKRCLDKGALVLGPTGKAFREDNIGMAMAMRNLNAHRRETGDSKGHNASFTKRDRSNLLQAIEKYIQKLLNS